MTSPHLAGEEVRQNHEFCAAVIAVGEQVGHLNRLIYVSI
jgi:hypothetical protein